MPRAEDTAGDACHLRESDRVIELGARIEHPFVKAVWLQRLCPRGGTGGSVPQSSASPLSWR